MTRRDLRNREPEFKARRTPKLSTVLKVLGILALLAALYVTSPTHTLPECRGSQVPRYCVD